VARRAQRSDSGTAERISLSGRRCAVQALVHGPELESIAVISWLRDGAGGVYLGPARWPQRQVAGPLQLGNGLGGVATGCGASTTLASGGLDNRRVVLWRDTCRDPCSGRLTLLGRFMPLIWPRLPSGQQGLLGAAGEAASLWSGPEGRPRSWNAVLLLASGSDHATGFWHKLSADRDGFARCTAALVEEAGSLLQVLGPGMRFRG